MKSPVILFIDDDETEGQSTFRKLTMLGFTPRFHRGPFGTLTAIRDTRCDMVLLDVNMPSLHGPTLVRFIRQMYENMPVILYSGMEQRTLHRIARSVGADAAISKNTPDDELTRVLLDTYANALSRAEMLVVSST